jgi:hypothetical protein
MTSCVISKSEFCSCCCLLKHSVSSEKLLRTCFEPAAAYMPGRLSEHLLLLNSVWISGFLPSAIFFLFLIPVFLNLQNRTLNTIQSPICVCDFIFSILFLFHVLSVRKLYSTTHNFFHTRQLTIPRQKSKRATTNHHRPNALSALDIHTMMSYQFFQALCAISLIRSC